METDKMVRNQRYYKTTREKVYLALEYIGIGMIVIVFSPIVVPVYACYAVGKVAVETWNRMRP